MNIARYTYRTLLPCWAATHTDPQPVERRRKERGLGEKHQGPRSYVGESYFEIALIVAINTLRVKVGL